MLRLGRHTFDDSDLLVMAIVNRTRDSFYDRGATYAEDAALDRVRRVADEGAAIVDIGGVKAGPGEVVDEAEEIRRTVGFVARVREEFPDLVISRRHLAGRGRPRGLRGRRRPDERRLGRPRPRADGGRRRVRRGVRLHAHRRRPARDSHRTARRTPTWCASAIEDTVALAERALAAGVARESLLIDPAHDFEKTTWHSLEITRRLDEMVATGWPVLVSLSNKDFVGETLGLPTDQRLTGTLAATAVSAWHGARVYRAHEVAETRQVLDMVASIRGDRPPAGTTRALA